MARSVDYDEVAPRYDRRYERNEYEGVEQALLTFVGDRGPRVLEAGCGTGHWLSLLAARGLAVAGVDASRGMLRRARERLPRAPLAQARAERLPWAGGCFDRVFCINAFHHFEAKADFVAEARRVLRPGGGFFSVGLDPHTGLDRWCVYDYFEGTLERDRERYPAASAIRAWTQQAGFRSCATEVAERIEYRLPAREALAHRHLDRLATSQLTLLSDAEHRRGVERIEADLGAAEARGDELRLGADLRLYATVAWV